MPVFHVAALAQVRHCTCQESIYVPGLKFLARATTVQNDPYSADHYELLRLSPGAEPEAVERVYRKLAKRFHPDKPETGGAEIFLRIAEAYRVLSDPQKRLDYDAERIATRMSPRFSSGPPSFFRAYWASRTGDWRFCACFTASGPATMSVRRESSGFHLVQLRKRIRAGE